MFDSLVWFPDHLVLGDVVLGLETVFSDQRNDTDQVMLHKNPYLIGEYQRFFGAFPDFHPSRVFELGLWDGGSLIFWSEVLKPQKIVGVDLADRKDKPSFLTYVQSRGFEARVAAYWNTDQSDKARLREIVAAEFQAPIDLVIDDCSHWYQPTKASFEALFPLIGPGGWYVLEDWDWGHKPKFVTRVSPWSRERPLTDLVTDLVKVLGSFPAVISRLIVQPGFVAIQRGGYHFEQPDIFLLENHIVEKSPVESATEGLQASVEQERTDEAYRVLNLQLQQKATSLDELYDSNAWKLIQAVRRLRLLLVPHDSLREKAWYAILRFFGKVLK